MNLRNLSSMKTFGIYARCSTEEQAKGFSHEYQISGIQNNPTVKEMKCLGVFKEAVSGTRFDNREQLDLVFNIYEQSRGDLNYLLVYRWDRLGRDVGEAFQTIKKFLSIGVQINCPDKWISFEDPNWPVILGIEFGIAQSESHKISERTKDGMYQAKLQGYFINKPPIGYKRVDTGEVRSNGKRVRILVPDENSDTVRTILETYAQGVSSKIELFREYREKLGIGRSAFYAIFQNIAYSGQIHLKAYKRHPARIIEAKHEALISKETFRQIQEREERDTRPGYSSSRSKARNNFFYLKGVLKCSSSGKHMTAYETRKKSGKSFFYYQTSKAKEGQLINAINAHQVVNLALNEITISKDLYTATRRALVDMISNKNSQNRKREREIKKSINTIQERVERIQDSFADGELSSDNYRTLQERYDNDLSSLGKELSTLSINHNDELNFRLRVLDFMSSIGDIFRMSDPKRKNILLRGIFPKGFSIVKEQVRTDAINYYMSAINAESVNYKHIKIKNGPSETESPSMGE